MALRKNVCFSCRRNDCINCLDVARIYAGLDEQCECTRKGHGGEPHGAPEHVCNDLCEMLNGE